MGQVTMTAFDQTIDLNGQSVVTFDLSQAVNELNDGKSFDLTPNALSEIGERIIRRIKDRTAGAVGANARGEEVPFNSLASATRKNYLDGVKIREGRSSGREITTGRSKANLKLSGDMLASLKVINTSSNTVTIGIQNDFQAAKAKGHHTGQLGRNRAQERPFMFLRQSDFSNDIDPIIKRNRPEQEKPTTQAQSNRIFAGLFSAFLKGSGNGGQT